MKKETEQVIAVNSKGHKQPFNRRAWEMLKNKGDWRELPAQVVENTVTAKQILPTGEAKPAQKIDNSAIKPASKPIKDEEIEQEKPPVLEKPDSGNEVSDEDKQAFLAQINTLTRRATMDFIDKLNETKNTKITYAKNISNDDLKQLLAEGLEYSVQKFLELSAA